MPTRTRLSLAIALALASQYAAAASTQFDNFTPLAASSPANPTGSPLETTTPLTLSSPKFKQQVIAQRNTQTGLGQFNSGAWDMITTNETGPNAGRYLFTVFESGQSGVQRTDTWNNNATQTLWRSPAAGGHVAFDASYWTPWGSFITAEESWTTAPGGATTSPYGRLYEMTNPLSSNITPNFVHRNVIPRTSHEGIQFDQANHMYFIDELNGGNVYRYSSAAGAGSSYFDAGKTSVLRIGDGNTPNATGAFSWVDITDASGNGLAGTLTITDPNGVVSLDARNTTDLAAFKGTDYQRPEDLQIKRAANGDELLFMATTTTNEVYTVNLTSGMVSVFADRNTINLHDNLAVGSPDFTSPDNLAMDAAGNIYIIEDQPGGMADIWFAKDTNHDGDLNDAGEGLALWASMNTNGAEPTGLYFDPFNPNRAWLNIQHPASGNDVMVELTAVPLPAALPLSLSALAALGLVARRRTA
ncbi:MAG TPA: DUF839 domain-containing protein [Pseudomonadales bacterium]|nr:DUF839 domain-containing protein [Pseudomonadales bacterium]